MAQDGTDIDTPGESQHQGWTEEYPYASVRQPIFGHAGYKFVTEVNHPGGNWGINFNLYDSYSGKSVNFQTVTSYYDGSSAEFITERPSVNGTPRNLSKFWYVNWLQAGIGTSLAPLGNFPNESITMMKFTDQLAYPVGGLTNGQQFTDDWFLCS